MCAALVVEPQSGGGDPVQNANLSLDDVVNQWMTEHGVKDVSKLDASQLDDLIAWLKKQQATSANPTQYNAFLSSLQDIKSKWESGKGLTPIEKEVLKLECQKEFGELLAKSSTGVNADFDATLNELNSKLTNLQKVSQLVNQSTSSWSAQGNSATVEQVESTIKEIDALEKQGVDIKALGLDKLKNDLQKSLDAYHQAMEKASKAGGDDKARLEQIALSDFRTAVSKDKVNYFKAAGLDESSLQIQAELKVQKTESIWRQNLSVPWDKTQTPNPQDFSPEGLAAYKQRLLMAREEAAARGDTIAMKNIDAKLAVITRAEEALKNGNNPTLDTATCLIYWVELKGVDFATKKALKEQALKNGDTKLADQLQMEMDLITELMKAVDQQLSSFLDKYSDMFMRSAQN